MSKNLRLMLALLGGMAAALVVTKGLEVMGYRLFPLPAGLDPGDPVDVAGRLGELPVGALVTVLLAHVLGTLVGAWVGVRLAGPKGRPVGLVVGLLMLSIVAMKVVSSAHPAWFALIDLPMIGAAAWAGMLLGARHEGREA